MKTKAKVKLLLEIELYDVWETDCTLAQINKQAKDSAVERIDRVFKGCSTGIRIIEKKAVAIIVEEE